MQFLGYERPGGRAGIRNYVSIIPVTSCSNELACAIADGAAGSVPVLHNYGCMRLKPDNDRAHRTLVGLGHNPNVAATLLVEMGCGMLDPGAMAQEIAASGTPVELLSVKSVGGYGKAIEAGRSIVRSMMAKASLQQRVPLPLGRLSVGIKCGGSATISSAAGHPATGHVVDTIVDEGGTAIFSETAEVIGAEHFLAKRFVKPEDAERFLALVRQQEELARATGEDIRNINPVPSNIRAGISSLEEKSLGATEKTGSRPIQGVLEYGEPPSGKGLWFMDGWPNGPSLQLGLACAGATVSLYQLGGGGLAPVDPILTPWTAGAITPLMWTTGNPQTYEKAIWNVDFSAGPVMLGEESVEEAGEQLLRLVLRVASGEWTKVETVNFDDLPEVPFRGPLF